MSRRYTDRYEERERDYYDRRPPRSRYDELEVEIDRERNDRRPARAPSLNRSVAEDRYRPSRQPEFLREGYGRDTAGELVVRETERVKDYPRKRESSVAASRREPSPPAEKVVKEEIIVKERIRDNASESGRSRKSAAVKAPIEREEIIEERSTDIRDTTRGRSRRGVDEEEIYFKRTDRDDSPPARRKEMVEDTEVYFRRGSSRPPPKRDFDLEERYYKEGIPSPPRREEREIEKEEFVFRGRAPSPPRRPIREVERDKVVIESRDREYSRPPVRYESLGPPIAREREEFYFRRRRPPSPSPSPSPPPPPRDYEREQIIIRRRESSPPPRSPSLASSPEPEPEPGPIREPSPVLPPIIRPPIIQHVYTHHHHIDHGLERARSPSPPPRSPSPPPVIAPPPPTKEHQDSLEIEIRRRGVRGGQEYYEKDVIRDRERDRERDRKEEIKEDVQVTRIRSQSAHQSRSVKKRDMWTEVSKELVMKEAIERTGYQFEEKADHYYIMKYLEYDDMVHLVDLSDDIRRKRRQDMEWKKEEEDRKSLTGARPKGRSDYYYEHDRIREVREVRDKDTRSVRSGRQR